MTEAFELLSDPDLRCGIEREDETKRMKQFFRSTVIFVFKTTESLSLALTLTFSLSTRKYLVKQVTIKE